MPAVLIVEDDLIIRSDMQGILEEQGYEVVSAGSSKEALARLGEDRDYGLILLDLGLPDATGAEFRAEQRSLAHRRNVPLVLLSGADDLTRAAEKLEAVECLGKPFRLQKLLDVVARYCRA
jgi:CheY-like chemotaxis protein